MKSKPTPSEYYYGNEAASYEEKRNNKRWRIEEDAFEELLRQIVPREIVDCPIGTGRWLKLYQDNLDLSCTTITGFDISPDMLEEAKSRARQLDVALSVRCRDLSDGNLPSFESDQGLFVSTRFLNWCHPKQLEATLEVFAYTNPKWIICSLRYTSEASPVEHIRLHAGRLWTKYIRRRKKPLPYIHKLRDFEQIVLKKTIEFPTA